MRFTDKLILSKIFILVTDYDIIYNVYYAINQDGELLIIAGVKYKGVETNILIEIIGVN